MEELIILKLWIKNPFLYSSTIYMEWYSLSIFATNIEKFFNIDK